MTANAMASDRLACLAAGMNEHVGKPFEMGHLVQVLLKVTDYSITPTPAVLPPEPPQSPSAVPTSPYLDVAAALERISGLTALYVDIAREFLQTLDAVEPEFRRAARMGETKVLVSQMHTLKGTAATLGADRLSRQAASLEALFRRDEPGLLPLEHLPALLEQIAPTRNATLQAISAMEVVTDAVPSSEPLTAGPAERARARTFLLELCRLMQASNLAVLDRFPQRGNALDAVPPQCVQDIQAALQSLNLDLALQLCEAQIAVLQ
jgi:HPt (histidine-containing phosphotransfer) domain-containing protein